MQARMNNPALVLPDAMQALFAVNKATENAGVPPVMLSRFGRWPPFWLSWRCKTINQARGKEPPWKRITKARR